MSFHEQKSFILSIPPFDALEDREIEMLCNNLSIEYFKQGQYILDSNTQEHFLYFIIKGKVQELASEADENVSILEKHAFFDPLSLIERRIKNRFKALEESICYLLPQEIFLKILHQNKKIEHFFFQSISEKLSENLATTQNKELASFMIAKVSDAYIQKPYSVDASESIYETVRTMKSHSLTSILVKKGEEFGIATDTDFREKVILERLSFDAKVEHITTFGLKSVLEDDFLFNAQLLMTRYGIKRLVVKNKIGEIIGILDQMSLTSFFSSHTYAIANEIERARDLAELKAASVKFIRIIKALFAQGVKVRYISKLLSELNRKLFEKLFTLLAPKGLEAHTALLVMGSEGRGEQILRTDQDNALIIADSCPFDDTVIAEFCERFSEALCDFGYPKCEGDIMVNNPLWRKRFTQFSEQLLQWVNRKDRDDFMNLAIFFDAYCIAGDPKLLQELKTVVFAKIEKNTAFLNTFGSFALLFPTPIGLFSDFKVDKNKHKNELDLKKGGVFPIVHGIRTLALENALAETNTVLRIKALNNLGILDKEFAGELIESFNYFHTLKLRTSLQKIDTGSLADNYINPDSLRTIDKDMLKDAFKVVNRFKKFLIARYKLEYV